MKIRVSIDSTCDLTPEIVKKYGMTVLPLTIIIDGAMKKDMEEITPEEIFAHVSAGGDLPKTSAVNVEEYRRVFTELLKDCDAIIHINLSAEMSAAHQNAVIAAEGLPVYPVDSRNLSSGSGLLAIEACELIEKGMDVEQIVAELKALIPKIDASFLLCQLDYLRKGGRCSAVAALGANILKLRPCIEVRDGAMGVARKYRGAYARCLEQYARDRLVGRDDIRPKRIFLTHTKIEPEIVETVRRVLMEAQPFEEIIEAEASCTISSHCGEGTLGVLYIHK